MPESDVALQLALAGFGTPTALLDVDSLMRAWHVSKLWWRTVNSSAELAHGVVCTRSVWQVAKSLKVHMYEASLWTREVRFLPMTAFGFNTLEPSEETRHFRVKGYGCKYHRRVATESGCSFVKEKFFKLRQDEIVQGDLDSEGNWVSVDVTVLGETRPNCVSSVVRELRLAHFEGHLSTWPASSLAFEYVERYLCEIGFSRMSFYDQVHLFTYVLGARCCPKEADLFEKMKTEYSNDERIRSIQDLESRLVQSALGNVTKVVMLLDIEKGSDRTQDRLTLLRNYSELVLYSPGLLAITQGRLTDARTFEQSREDLWASDWWTFPEAAPNLV